MDNRIKLIWAIRSRMVAGQQMQLHAHTCLQVYYVLSGTGVFIINGKSIHVESGDFFAIPIGVQHRTLPYEKNGCESIELKVILNDPFLQENLRIFHSPFKDTGAIRNTMEYIVKYWSCQDPQNQKDIEYLLTGLLMQLFLKDLHYDYPESKYIITEHYNTITRSIFSFVDDNFAKKISIRDLSSALGYNKNYLSTIFHKDTGFSIIDYVNYLRIRRAIHYFAFYGQDVFTTFESTGFSSLSYFSITFKTIVGVSPRDFRLAFMRFRKEMAECFMKEPILNFLPCTIEEGFSSMKKLGRIVSDYRDKDPAPSEANNQMN